MLTGPAVCLLALALVSLAPASSAQSTTRVSVDSAGSQASEGSDNPAVSADGRYVAFTSGAPNLVAGDTNAAADIFLRDRQADATVLVSLDSAGAQGNNTSTSPTISGDGRVVVFMSYATNLVMGDTNAASDVFARDTLSGTTVRVSLTPAGGQGNANSGSPSVSANGRFVAFHSDATNLVPGDTNGTTDVFIRDLITGAVTRVSVDSSGIQGNDASTSPSISADGNYVAYQSSASNLVASDTNATVDVFVYDRLNATTVRANLSTGGAQALGYSGAPDISGDGRFVVFWSQASNLVANDTNSGSDVFLRDLVAGTTTRVSVTYSGAQASSGSLNPTISGSGQRIAYETTASILPGGGVVPHIYIHDITTSSVLRVSAASGGIPGNAVSTYGTLSADGDHVAFVSDSTNLVPDDTNARRDVFLFDLSAPPWVLYCFGDGSATPCPCGNASAPGSQAGCRNSAGSSGRIDALGMPSVTGDTLVLQGSGMTNGTCLYFQATAQLNGGLGVVLGDGLRCAGGTVIRLGITSNTSGASQYPGTGDALVSVKGLCTPGLMRSYQVWYRDAASYCAPETYNLTNGLALAWRP